VSDFERGQIVGARLATASVTTIAILLGVSRGTVCKVMSAYTNNGKTTSANISEQKQWVKINIDRKRSSCVRTGLQTQKMRRDELSGCFIWLCNIFAYFWDEKTLQIFENKSL
jgi:hypothetical protein